MSSGSYENGNWYHICGWYNSSTTTDKKIFVDGDIVASDNNSHSGNNLGTNDTRYGYLGWGSEASNFDGNNQLGTILEAKPKIKRPSLYKVIILNVDYTPMEFVVEILQTYFSKSSEDATRFMLHIHQRGVGICGLYTYEIAESKATQVLEKARKNQHPLQIKLEKE